MSDHAFDVPGELPMAIEPSRIAASSCRCSSSSTSSRSSSSDDRDCFLLFFDFSSEPFLEPAGGLLRFLLDFFSGLGGTKKLAIVFCSSLDFNLPFILAVEELFGAVLAVACFLTSMSLGGDPRLVTMTSSSDSSKVVFEDDASLSA